METVVQQFTLCYPSSAFNGKALSFPCNQQGDVDMEQLTERARNNYFYARMMLGREFLSPVVQLA